GFADLHRQQAGGDHRAARDRRRREVLSRLPFMRHPGFRLSAVATATALLHGGLIALALHAAAPAVARHEPSRVMLRMIAPATRPMVSAPAAAAVKPVTPVPRPRAAARAAAP